MSGTTVFELAPYTLERDGAERERERERERKRERERERSTEKETEKAKESTHSGSPLHIARSRLQSLTIDFTRFIINLG